MPKKTNDQLNKHDLKITKISKKLPKTGTKMTQKDKKYDQNMTKNPPK
jgi:hypothetical protein